MTRALLSTALAASFALSSGAGMAQPIHDGGGAPDLIQAARWGDVWTVRRLLTRGADVNARADGAAGPHGGATALMLAVEGGHVETARLLLVYGADVNAVEKPDPPAGRPALTPLMAAARRGDADMVRLLMDHGADASFQIGETALYPQGVTALMLAEVRGHTAAADALRGAGIRYCSLWIYLVLAVWGGLWSFILIGARER